MKAVDSKLLELAARQHFLVGPQEVRRAGMTSRQWARRVNSGLWVPMHPTLWRHVATPVTWELSVRAGAKWLGSEAAVAGRTAARWWGLDSFEDDEIVEFVVPRVRRSLRGVRVHTTRHWSSKDLLRHRGVRVTSVTRTVTDLAAYGAPARQLEAAIDSGVRLRRTAVPPLQKRLADLSERRAPGVRRVREILLDAGGESDLERRFLRLLRQSGLPRPLTQVVLSRASDRAMRVDFLFERCRVVVEVSGRLGHTSDRERQKDARRRNALQNKGFAVIEFTTADVIDDPVYVVTAVRDAIS